MVAIELAELFFQDGVGLLHERRGFGSVPCFKALLAVVVNKGVHRYLLVETEHSEAPGELQVVSGIEKVSFGLRQPVQEGVCSCGTVGLSRRMVHYGFASGCPGTRNLTVTTAGCFTVLLQGEGVVPE